MPWACTTPKQTCYQWIVGEYAMVESVRKKAYKIDIELLAQKIVVEAKDDLVDELEWKTFVMWTRWIVAHAKQIVQYSSRKDTVDITRKLIYIFFSSGKHTPHGKIYNRHTSVHRQSGTKNKIALMGGHKPAMETSGADSYQRFQNDWVFFPFSW